MGAVGFGRQSHVDSVVDDEWHVGAATDTVQRTSELQQLDRGGRFGPSLTGGDAVAHHRGDDGRQALGWNEARVGKEIHAESGAQMLLVPIRHQGLSIYLSIYRSVCE